MASVLLWDGFLSGAVIGDQRYRLVWFDELQDFEVEVSGVDAMGNVKWMQVKGHPKKMFDPQIEKQNAIKATFAEMARMIEIDRKTTQQRLEF